MTSYVFLLLHPFSRTRLQIVYNRPIGLSSAQLLTSINDEILDLSLLEHCCMRHVRRDFGSQERKMDA